MTPGLQNLISSSLEKGVSKLSSVLPCLVSSFSFSLYAFLEQRNICGLQVNKMSLFKC